MSLITFPLLNSENFYEVGVLPTNEFHTRHFLSDWWIDTIYDWQKYNRFGGVKPSQFYVLKQLDQTVTIQFNIPTTGISFFNLKMLSCDGTLRAVSPSAYMTQTTIAGNVYDDNGRIPPIPLKTVQYRFKPSDISGVIEGIYYFLITVDDGVETQYISEPTYIKETWEDTILINYRNSANDYDVVVSLNPSFSVRLDATLSEPLNEFNPTTFRNQKGNLRQVRARNWRKYTLTIGAAEGTNGIIVDKIANILKCDNIYIDGKKMLLSEGSDIEVNPFSQNYPLSTIKVELEEYYNNDSVVIGNTSLVYIMDLGSFPYVISEFVMADELSSYGMLVSYPTLIAEAHDTTMEDAIIAQLNIQIASYGKLGTFIKDSGALYYQKATGENIYRASFEKIDTTLQVKYTTVTAARDIIVSMVQLGHSIISVWKTPTIGAKGVVFDPTQYLGTIGDTFTVATNDVYTLYLYSDSTATRVDLATDIPYKLINELTGKMSVNLQEFRISGATMSVLDLSFLFNSATELRALNWQYTTIDSVDTTGFSVPIGSQYWRYFNFIYLLNNSLDPAALDDILNDYQTYILYTWFGLYPVGVIDLRSQAPSATRTTASDLAVTNLTATGYTILP